jgi:hypothetical protein
MSASMALLAQDLPLGADLFKISFMMLVKDLLTELDLGNSVAEYDSALERYFVETATFGALSRDEGDIIAGDKGTGKTALFRILQQRYTSIEELNDVEVIPAFNPVGNPVFQRLAESEVLEEGQYVTIWKAYVIALVGNWVLALWADAPTDSMHELDPLLRRMGLRSEDDDPTTIFSQLVNVVRRLMNPKSVEMVTTITPDGFPVVIPLIELGDVEQPVSAEPQVIPHDEALGLLNRVLDEVELSIWMVLDRLDEAFQGFPSSEIPALRALLRTYLDLQAFPRLRLKLFLRNDLFARIIEGGFVNLTHVYAKKIDIVWDEEDLFDLLIRRFRENPAFLERIGVAGGPDDDVFYGTFPEKVDAGSRKPTTRVWMMGRIRDGNGVRPPRNLIDLAKKAQEEQLRREDRRPTEYSAGQPVISSDALKKGLARLSAQRVQDTLLAEAGDYAGLVERFRSGKAEHNMETLAERLGMKESEIEPSIRILVDLGFLEQVGATYKIPMLYRDGLDITQGKAFSSGSEGEEDDEEEV